jgi:hypothetical protein
VNVFRLRAPLALPLLALVADEAWLVSTLARRPQLAARNVAIFAEKEMKPPFGNPIPEIYVLWHPRCDLGEFLARNIHAIWRRPLNIEAAGEGKRLLLSFDSKEFKEKELSQILLL